MFHLETHMTWSRQNGWPELSRFPGRWSFLGFFVQTGHTSGLIKKVGTIWKPTVDESLEHVQLSDPRTTSCTERPSWFGLMSRVPEIKANR